MASGGRFSDAIATSLDDPHPLTRRRPPHRPPCPLRHSSQSCLPRSSSPSSPSTIPPAQSPSSARNHSNKKSAIQSMPQSSNSSPHGLPHKTLLSAGIDEESRCGHCKSFAPAYSKAAEHMKGTFPFAAIDCDNAANRPLCAEFGVKGFPTVKLMRPVSGNVQPLGTLFLNVRVNRGRLYGTTDGKGTD